MIWVIEEWDDNSHQWDPLNRNFATRREAREEVRDLKFWWQKDIGEEFRRNPRYRIVKYAEHLESHA